MSDHLAEVRQTAIELLAHVQNTTPGATIGSDVAAPPNHGGMAVIDVSAVGGDADETYEYHIQGRNETADPLEDAAIDDDGEDIVAPGGQVTQPNGAQVFTQRVKPFRLYRITTTLAGTTPDVTSGAHLVLVDSTRPPASAQDPT